MQTPAADIHVDESLVHALLSEQHPDLTGDLRLVANGWDNVIFRLGDELAVRMPRRDVAAHLIAHEQRWLPFLAGALPVPVPVPVRVGAPSERFRWPWSVVRWVEGIDAADATASERTPLAVPLARFVSALHTPAPHTPNGMLHPDVPLNPVRGVPLASRDRAVRERLWELQRLWDITALGELWEESLSAPRWHGVPIWLHGDLHPGNLLLDDRGDLAAVIDFGDLTAGDPATDLATAWLTFGPEARRVFRAVVTDASEPESGAADAATWLRARGWALCMGTALATASDDNPRMHALGTHVLSQLLREAYGR
ncbi:aminoglycoside phosphotransferase family protein [Planctomonas sp. JC2975]|uniref:aminoglycoside phosphotransferase family protein n=1 Tax=Planctomonas sp. JC2975 TaxID=2729626 RepID=UPI001473A62D|nr:aminoglycoside phosphotransferase family protein [Planctomonas sp. JC2975]NNC11969.1 aminoglycoside phosphotransferase family protein [Planctomonas sp. JC2975]